MRSGVGPILSVVSVVASGIGRRLVGQGGDWSAGRTGVGRGERDLSVDASGIQRGYSGGWSGIDTLFNQSGNFLPDHTRPSNKNWSGMSGGWSGVWCECSLRLQIHEMLQWAIIVLTQYPLSVCPYWHKLLTFLILQNTEFWTVPGIIKYFFLTTRVNVVVFRQD